MKVSPKEPFQLIYSIFAHEYLGYLFESFVVKKDSKGKLTLTHQNISSKNAAEFSEGLEEDDYKIIELMDSIQQDAITNKFSNKHLKPDAFLTKIFDKDKGDKLVVEAITNYIDGVKARILPLLHNKEVYAMSNDGEPAGTKIEVPQQKATVLFHFYRNDENTHYFPTIQFNGEKQLFQYNGSQILCKNPAWVLISEQRILSFDKEIDGNKLKPFLNKKFIVIPKTVEEKYYQNFISPIVANFDVYAKGFIIKSEQYEAKPILGFKELIEANSSMELFKGDGDTDTSTGKFVFDLAFAYGEYRFASSGKPVNSVSLEKIDNDYIFHKVKRNSDYEYMIHNLLSENGITFKNGKAVIDKSTAFSWLNDHKHLLEKHNIEIQQGESVVNGQQRRYFVGKSSINIEVKESNDWFDIYAIIQFGDYKIPFIKLKKLVISGETEFKLPNGEIAIIPREWLTQYSDLFHFGETDEDGDSMKLNKHHISLVQALEEGNLATVNINKKLQKLKEFENIDDYAVSDNFKGDLRPYQKAGYNWMKFLSDYNFGGCLADDMGLGKTVQTLAMLQTQKENEGGTSLLIMPTSLVYNWEVEARKFTPDLKVLVYTGTYRDKNILRFGAYDIVLTSYGITRIDIDLMKEFYFNYIILDESQAIKNPTSNISGAVKQLKSKSKLILTGTPIENSTLDLWSQMSFVNPGLLGSQSYFKKHFQTAIEKKGDEERKKKLYALIKPFILRRNKAQVLTELPPKIEQIRYAEMTDAQEKEYEEVKSFYRNQILQEIDEKGMGKSQITILQGLTKLRQIANHPRMVDEKYEHSSGKMDEALDMLTTSMEQGHKILVFSQFVKHLALFEEALKKKNVQYAYLDGGTKDRQGEVEKFQNNEDIKLFLISLKAGGLGLNLTAADYVFILDPWWNPAIEAQAVDRAYRMGQTRTVNTYKFITRNSVEEKILRLQESKKQLASELISTEESFVKNLSKEDIEDILA